MATAFPVIFLTLTVGLLGQVVGDDGDWHTLRTVNSATTCLYNTRFRLYCAASVIQVLYAHYGVNDNVQCPGGIPWNGTLCQADYKSAVQALCEGHQNDCWLKSNYPPPGYDMCEGVAKFLKISYYCGDLP